MPTIRFDHQSLVFATRFGQIRTRASRHRKDNWGLVVGDDRHSQVTDARRQTIGTMGEWAVANYFGQDYEFTVDSFKAPDVWVGEWGIQVKASEIGKFFIIRPDAQDWEPYVYCTVELPTYPDDPREYRDKLPKHEVGRVHIQGWMFPHEARERAQADPSLIRDPGNRNSPAIFIPVAEIHPIYTLKEMIGKERDTSST